MIQDIIVIPLIALLAGLGAVVVMRAMWKTKRRRRDVPLFDDRGRGVLERRAGPGSENWRS